MLERIDLLAGEVRYRAKQFDAAIGDFERIGKSESPLAAAAMFNAALSWLQKGDETKFLADAEEFGKKAKDQKSAGDLRLEAGLTEAAKDDPRAPDSLRTFLREFPNSERASEAWVALAHSVLMPGAPAVAMSL